MLGTVAYDHHSKVRNVGHLLQLRNGLQEYGMSLLRGEAAHRQDHGLVSQTEAVAQPFNDVRRRRHKRFHKIVQDGYLAAVDSAIFQRFCKGTADGNNSKSGLQRPAVELAVGSGPASRGRCSRGSRPPKGTVYKARARAPGNAT